jgi:hypothetical protein
VCVSLCEKTVQSEYCMAENKTTMAPEDSNKGWDMSYCRPVCATCLPLSSSPISTVLTGISEGSSAMRQSGLFVQLILKRTALLIPNV